jgi:Zn-dependent protease with chaperone function
VDCIVGGITHRRPSVSYQLGLAVVAFLMVLLPVIYAGLILLAGWGVWHHATNDLFILQRTSGLWLSLPFYFGPIVAGLTLIAFMVKPLFAGRPPASPAVALDAGQERLLFTLIERICRVVGAPPPRRVEVNCAVNAAAGFRRGAASLFGQDLTLSIGLPLVAGLSARQFAGVLAHEFGHFSQGAGMRLTYVIRQINQWFFRVVYERDRWDFALERAARAADFYTGVVWHAARGCIWLTRRILWVLAHAGHAVSCYMLRQMEYDADRCASQLAGSDTFRETMLRLQELNLASNAAFAALRHSWHAQRLPDSLPQFIVGTIPGIPPEVREETGRLVAESKTGIFDTHPCDTDRMRAAEALDAPGVFRSTDPATALFRDFASLSRRVTRLSYEKEYALPIRHQNLVDTETCLRESNALRATRALSERYFGGVSTVFHPISIGPPELLPLPDPEAGLAELRSARARMRAAVTRARYAQGQQEQIGDCLSNAENALALLTAGFAIEPVRFGLKTATPGAAAEVIASLEDERKRSGAPLVEYSLRARARLTAALRQLRSPTHAGRIADAQVLQQEVARLVQALAVLAPALLPLHDLGRKFCGWQLLLMNRAHHSDPARVDGVIHDLAERLRGLVRQVSRCISGVSYPFPTPGEPSRSTSSSRRMRRRTMSGRPSSTNAWPASIGCFRSTTRCSAGWRRSPHESKTPWFPTRPAGPPANAPRPATSWPGFGRWPPVSAPRPWPPDARPSREVPRPAPGAVRARRARAVGGCSGCRENQDLLLSGEVQLGDDHRPRAVALRHRLIDVGPHLLLLDAAPPLRHHVVPVQHGDLDVSTIALPGDLVLTGTQLLAVQRRLLEELHVSRVLASRSRRDCRRRKGEGRDPDGHAHPSHPSSSVGIETQPQEATPAPARAVKSLEKRYGQDGADVPTTY